MCFIKHYLKSSRHIIIIIYLSKKQLYFLNVINYDIIFFYVVSKSRIYNQLLTEYSHITSPRVSIFDCRGPLFCSESAHFGLEYEIRNVFCR